jgi:hypothetical protein|tara:strand:- start:87 stop:1724 length:1638 start_codon:yes stop_codon:yes gene_type:complete
MYFAPTTLWLLCGPLLVGSFAALVACILSIHDDPILLITLILSALLVFLLRARLGTPGARSRILSGNSPYGFFKPPKTVNELLIQLRHMYKDTGVPPSIVGSGWGWFIGREYAQNAVFTHALKGHVKSIDNYPLEVDPYSGGGYIFLAGTELRDAEEYIRKDTPDDKRTFWSTPTMQRISIGSWLGRSCHGNSGPAGRPSSHAALYVLVINIKDIDSLQAKPIWRDYRTYKIELDKNPERYIIAAVYFSLRRMVNDFALQKRMVTVEPNTLGPTEGLMQWLTDKAVLRVLFFGSARSEAVGVTYTTCNKSLDKYSKRRVCGFCRKVPHIDPHGCSAQCMSMQLDTCSIVCGYYEKSKDAWNGVIMLSKANAFSPDPSWLGFPIIALLSTTVNFELIFILEGVVVGNPGRNAMCVQRLCNTLLGVFNRNNFGRSELRMGDLNDGLVFVDVVMRPHEAHRLLSKLQKHVYDNTVALHSSKYQSMELRNTIEKHNFILSTPRAVFGLRKKERLPDVNTQSNTSTNWKVTFTPEVLAAIAAKYTNSERV